MEHLSKILEFAGKFSWAVMLAIAFVLFTPDSVAREIGIADIRAAYKGILWIALVLSAGLWSIALFGFVDRHFIGEWLTSRRRRRENEEAQEKFRETVLPRLRALNDDEMMWVQSALFENTQTLKGRVDNVTGQSLRSKKLVFLGDGNVFSIPYTFTDDVWRILQEHRDEFLPPEVEQDQSFPAAVETFKRLQYGSH
jgi:hypothetical protein